ncbi:CagC family type IV secretion system protein [Sporosarcina aquimarina]|uniref:CagC family type IV secretion system protein n=1 Tax=Sporosarcina aquimarina TaxID=114975 RepID=UPI0020424F66|nr:CagC family type IV secretion system protein [Sporosarcina aquimarina]MCM3755986.1 CagC family type IV secretion system protein [Sporosarcina aquimarina]
MTKQHVKIRFAFSTALALLFCLAVIPEIVFASAGQVQAKLTNAANVVKGILTALVVLVGVCVALFIIIKRMPGKEIHVS